MDPSLYPAPSGKRKFLAVSSLYWEFEIILGFPDGYTETVAEIQRICQEESGARFTN
jgi:hypothetical protein